ncbi:metalloregulator ArsR/SmtB family transcription factor [Parahaliea maris]|uniref:Metalloregulator ArsR/SmtB family transcription factor n=1 Tax=Parahaliea maris TaxID=2716870 RepID=A0A5C8ZZR9_9GAMM|nr:metalloregulator ArsR/SmtB family transcription factor [Parahaliea maris]TXS94103.1 metalloregulator ArsR/SmtB family transcription factor [Parahaliea maris]
MSPLAFYKCLSDDTRLKSLLLLTDCRPLCVCELMVALDLSQPKVSRHLAELRDCDLVEGERRGRWVYYRLHPELPDWSRQVLEGTAAACTDYLVGARERLAQSDSVPACN